MEGGNENVPTLKELFDLTGKVALVTGGSRGLGFEMAEGLAEAGASLMLLARREQWLTPAVEEFQKRGFKCSGMICDVANADQVQAAVDKTIDEYGKIDILLNNAGISWGAPAQEMPADKWKMVLDVNLTGAFLFCQAAGREMLKRKSGVIINVASIAGLIGTTEDGQHIAGYVAAKGGLIALTRELAAKWGRHGIRVNAIAPGFFPSRMTEKIIDVEQKRAEATTPLGRVGAEGELKGVCVLLASAASGYMTGTTVVVDGGTTCV
ncbi:MAG TPA: SDR family oxidoreductase [Blastocatellia bacterium]|nr:SDR family oxidoreductase [Blastocatellia bacterium]